MQRFRRNHSARKTETSGTTLPRVCKHKPYLNTLRGGGVTSLGGTPNPPLSVFSYGLCLHTRGTVVPLVSVFRSLWFLRNRCMDRRQILWEATYPPYLQTIFFSKCSIFIFLPYLFFPFSLIWDPRTAKIKKQQLFLPHFYLIPTILHEKYGGYMIWWWCWGGGGWNAPKALYGFLVPTYPPYHYNSYLL